MQVIKCPCCKQVIPAAEVPDMIIFGKCEQCFTEDMKMSEAIDALSFDQEDYVLESAMEQHFLDKKEKK